MATTNLTTILASDILIQFGNGSPDHSAPQGSQYTDVDTAKIYCNTSGGTDWIEVGGAPAVIVETSTARTLVAADLGSLIICTNASDCVITVNTGVITGSSLPTTFIGKTALISFAGTANKLFDALTNYRLVDMLGPQADDYYLGGS